MDIPNRFAEDGRRMCKGGVGCRHRVRVLQECEAEAGGQRCPITVLAGQGALVTSGTLEELDDIGPSCWNTDCRFLRRAVLPNGAPGTCSCESLRTLCPKSGDGALLTAGTREAE